VERQVNQSDQAQISGAAIKDPLKYRVGRYLYLTASTNFVVR
jgi:hypothetical protein